MSSGILGTYDLYSGLSQAVYVNNYLGPSVTQINVTNRNAADIRVSVAISESATDPADYEWIEYNVLVGPNGVLLRSGVVIDSGKYIVVQTNRDSVNCVVTGNTSGDPVDTPITLTQSSGLAPVWVTPSSFFYDSQKSDASYQLSATGPEIGESISYSLVGGSLPSGTSLSSTGLISGLTTGTGASSAIVRAIDSRANTTNRTFTITKRYLDGSSAALAAPSGYYIAQYITGATSGYYWIKSATMPTALQMYVDMTEDGGGYDFYAFDNNGVGTSPYANGDNSGLALGLDIVYPRSKYHWRAMSNFVYTVLGKRSQAYQNFFRTCYGVYKETSGGNFTSTIMRDATYYGSGSTSHRVKDGGRWWLRDSTFGEPNGDYDAYAFFGLNAGGYTFPEPYGLQDIGFNDGSSSYSLGSSYLVSTNAKP